MPRDFLNTTTYDNDALANGDMTNMIMSMAHQSNEQPEQENTQPGEDIEESDDLDDHLSSQMDNSDDDEPDEEPEHPTQIVDKEEDDPMNDSFLQSLLQPSTSRPRRVTRMPSGVIADATNDDGDDSDIGWLSKKSTNVNLSHLDGRIRNYLNSIPDEYKKGMVATSGNDDVHMKGSKHYQNQGIDIRYNDNLYKYIVNDKKLGALGLETVNPNHGTAPHIHIETKQFGGTTHNSKYTISNEKMF